MNRFASIIIIVGMFCSGIMIGVEKYFPSREVQNEPIAEVVKQADKYDEEYQVGEVIQIDKYNIIIHEAGYIDTIEENHINLRDNYGLYTIDATITNNADQLINVSRVIQTKLYIDDVLYNVDNDSALIANTLDKKIMPGESLRGNIILQIPLEVETIKLRYTKLNESITINLLKDNCIER